MTSIGDLLSERSIPWKYYGGSYNVSGTGAPLDGIYCNICNPFEYQLNHPAMRADHMRDVTDLFSDLKNGTLPAVSYVKPDGAMDGHRHHRSSICSKPSPRTSSSLPRVTRSNGKALRSSSRWARVADTMTPASSSRLISSAPGRAFR
jgi:hypothetical protein